MTTTRTLRESSKYLSKQYKFLRKLGTDPSISRTLEERDEYINLIPSVKDVVILEPVVFDPVIDPRQDISEVAIEQHRVFIDKHNTKWPFRIEFVEQLLDVNCIWVVTITSRAQATSYQASNGAISGQSPTTGITVDMTAINDPTIHLMSPHKGPYWPSRPIMTEKHLRDLEKKAHQELVIRGDNPNQSIDAYDCNILPYRQSRYNCTFYNRDVAHLYLESVADFINRAASSAPRHL